MLEQQQAPAACLFKMVPVVSSAPEAPACLSEIRLAMGHWPGLEGPDIVQHTEDRLHLLKAELGGAAGATNHNQLACALVLLIAHNCTVVH